MQKGQKQKRNFPHVKGLQTKRTKNGHRYVLTETDDDGRTHSITVKILETDSEKEFLNKVEEAREKLRKRDNGKSYEEYLNDYFMLKQLSQNTQTTYMSVLKNYSLDNESNRREIDRLLVSKRKSYTKMIYVRIVSRFFSWLMRKNADIQNPAEGLTIKASIHTRSRILTDNEINRINQYALAKKPLYRLFILLLLNTGARVSSIIAIRKSDLSKKGLTLYNVKCKKYYDYMIPIKDKRITDLWDNCFDVGSIFGENGERYAHRLNKWMRITFGVDARGETVSIHSFRHTFASRAAMNGIPIEVISKLLDHQSVATTAKFYARFSQKQIDDAVKKTLKAYQPNPQPDKTPAKPQSERRKRQG